MKRALLWTLLAVLLITAGWYRWVWLHKDNPTAVELWGQMNKATQEKFSVEITRSYIRLHPKCRRSSLDIKSYPDALVIRVICDERRNDEGISNVQLIKHIESERR